MLKTYKTNGQIFNKTDRKIKSYEKVFAKEFNNPIILEMGETLKENIDFKANPRYTYKLRVRGEANIPYEHRTEDLYPIYFRKLEDSLINTSDGYSLEFNERNYAHERSAYYMLALVLKYFVQSM